jgi:hypothetical protein
MILQERGNWQIVDVNDFGNIPERERKEIAAAGLKIPVGSQYGITIEEVPYIKETVEKLLSKMVVANIATIGITGVQIVSDGYDYRMAFNNNTSQIYSAEDILKGNGIEFKTIGGKRISQDVHKLAIGNFNANQSAKNACEELIRVLGNAMKNIVAANQVLTNNFISK